MADKKPSDLAFASFRGGMNDTDPEVALQDDQVVLARNVEFFRSMLGERRAGCVPIDLTGAGFGGTGEITVFAPSAANWGVIGLTLSPSGVISVGNTGNGGFGAGVNTYTASYTVNAASDYLLVCVLGDLTTDKVTGVTFNGVSMSQLKKFNSGANTGWMYVYGLAAPATGAHNVVISASGNCTSLGFEAIDYLNMGSSQPDSSITQTVGSVGPYSVDYLVVGGGAGGAFVATGFGVLLGGGGGAGGLLTGTTTVTPGTNYTITVGGGGAPSGNGGVSSFGVIASCSGGGTGGTYTASGTDGGSGGGIGGDSPGTPGHGIPGQGHDGGGTNGFANASGGGGGAGAVGNGPAGDGLGGSGGVGISSSITGSAVLYASGGAGGSNANGVNPGDGGGGSQGDGGPAGSGAAGIVVIRYTGPQVATGGTITTDGTHTIHTFSSPGTFTFGAGGTTAGSVQTNYAPVAAGTFALQFSVNTQAAQTSITGGTLRVFATTAVGMSATLADSGPLAAQAGVVHLAEWFPLGDQYNSELWAVGATPNTSTEVSIARRSTLSAGNYVWSVVTPDDPILTNTPDIYLINTQPLDGLFFWAYNSGIDRLHVWDTVLGRLRRAGLAQPGAAPVPANGGGGGALGGTGVIYRTRFVQVNGSTVVRRSEPSANSTTFTPDGSHAAVVVTLTATPPGEGETHWEVEAADVNTSSSIFYRIARVAINTTTYNNTLAASQLSGAGVVSEAIGAYLTPPSGKYLGVDNDRLLIAGHWFDPTKFSTVFVTPTGADPGVGNGERVPIVTTGGTAITTAYRLDNNVGGPITGLAAGLLQPQFATTSSPQSVFYVFKWQRIYMMVGTGQVANPYTVTTVSDKRGAIPDTVFQGIDETGGPCVYFIDPLFGPSRISQVHGLEILYGMRTTWESVNVIASDVVACGAFYPFKRRAEWYVSTNGSNVPNKRIRLQVAETGHAARGATDYDRGWVVDDGRIGQALCISTYTELVTENGHTKLSVRPVIGLTAPDYVQRTDVGSTDAGQAFTATIISKPYDAGTITQMWGTMRTALLMDTAAGVKLNLFLIRDFGVETFGPYAVSGDPAELESKVLNDIDNMASTGARYIQFELTDSSTVVLS